MTLLLTTFLAWSHSTLNSSPFNHFSFLKLPLSLTSTILLMFLYLKYFLSCRSSNLSLILYFNSSSKTNLQLLLWFSPFLLLLSIWLLLLLFIFYTYRGVVQILFSLPRFIYCWHFAQFLLTSVLSLSICIYALYTIVYISIILYLICPLYIVHTYFIDTLLKIYIFIIYTTILYT